MTNDASTGNIIVRKLIILEIFFQLFVAYVLSDAIRFFKLFETRIIFVIIKINNISFFALKCCPL